MTDFPTGSGQEPQGGGYPPPGPGYPSQGSGFMSQRPAYPPPGSGYVPPAPGEPPRPGYPAGSGYPAEPGYPAGSGHQAGPGYPVQGPGYSTSQRLRPGRAWYLLALAVVAAGVAWLVFGIVSLASTVNGLQRVPLPTGGAVSLTHSGGYTVYYEGPGAQSGRIPAFHIHVAAASAGAAASSLTQYRSTLTYNFGSHQGRAVLTLHVTSPGRFAVTATGAPSGADLAFGGSIGSGIVGVVLPAVPLIILGALGGLVLLIVRIVRKRAMQPGYAQS